MNCLASADYHSPPAYHIHDKCGEGGAACSMYDVDRARNRAILTASRKSGRRVKVRLKWGAGYAVEGRENLSSKMTVVASG